ncbi:MAG: alanine racemase [Clostridia bacterium]|nr:alanine racemase [Clostridia bacterium]
MDFLHRAWAEIDTAALIHNFEKIKELANGASLMAVVKADAYGHSAEIVVPILDKHGADCFAVSNLDEALQLRSIGIKKPILILGYTPVTAVKELAQNGISQCVYSEEYANQLSRQAVLEGIEIKIHIKLDTGMSRLGFNCRNSELTEIKTAITSAQLKGFVLEGVFTHFSSADSNKPEDIAFTQRQYSLFKLSLEQFRACGLNPSLCHCSNSAGIIEKTDPDKSLHRPGIILYGLMPSETVSPLEALIPVMTLKSVVTMVKEISEGESVSYGRTYKAEKNMKLATVSIGYADGYPRILSGKAYVIINGKKAPVVGRVCMDQLTVDVSEIEAVSMGDEVILFGKELPVSVLAKLCNTIDYEIVCSITARVPRISK